MPADPINVSRPRWPQIVGFGSVLATAAVVFALLSPRSDRESQLYAGANPEVPAVLARALQHEEELRACQTVSVQPVSGGTMTVTRSRLKLPDGSQLHRTLRAFAGLATNTGRSVTYSDLVIRNESGEWHLFPGAAIRQPAPDKQLVDTMLASIGTPPTIPPRYFTRPDTWNGRPCQVVVRVEAPAAIAFSVDVLRGAIARRKALAAPGLKAVEYTPEEFALARTEFFVDPTLNFVVRRHAIALSGTTLTDEGFQSVDLAPSLTPEVFAVPADAVLLFPKDAAEYSALSGKYALIARINPNPK